MFLAPYHLLLIKVLVMSTESLLAEYTYYTDVIYVIFKFGSDKAPKLLSSPLCFRGASNLPPMMTLMTFTRFSLMVDN